MRTITQSYHIEANAKAVWQALTDQKTIEAWGAGPAKMSDESGKRFALWGGDIYGANIEVKQGQKLVQDWYAYDWEQPSKVTFVIKDEHNATLVELKHEDIPDAEADKIEAGWNEYYLGAIKKYLEQKSTS